jgi:hypothetical protein
VAGRLDSLAGTQRDLAIVAATSGWLTTLLVTDRWSDLAVQWISGVVTWLVLVRLLRAETPVIRTQVAVVVVFATVVEYTFSAYLGIYRYRLGNVPVFVPPGHGLVYLGSLALGRALARGPRLPPIALTFAVGGAYALWGLVGTDRVDALGAFWFGCLVVFQSVGRSGLLYVGAFVIVTYLELLGTGLGVWEWQRFDPTGFIGIGNPPSGAAGGYAWFDLAAVLCAPALVRRFGRTATPVCRSRGRPVQPMGAVRGDRASARTASTGPCACSIASRTSGPSR